MRVLQLRMTHRVRVHMAGAELFARDACRAAEVPVMHRQVHVREPVAAVQRSKAAAVVIAEPDRAKAPAAPASPPRMEMVTRSQGKPANSAPAAETVPKADSKP